MKKYLAAAVARLLCVGVLLAWVTPALADQLQDGKLAMDQGKFSEAMALLLPLAESGNAEAQFFVGVMHTNAQGVPANRTEAVRWFLLAAEQGNVDAQYSLGQEYALGGPGLERSLTEAHFWFVLATEGYEAAGRGAADSASQFRESMAAKLTPEQLAENERRLGEWKEAH